MVLFGWDASVYDHAHGSMDMARAYADGVRFLTHRGAIGTIYKDTPGVYLQRARDAGIPFIGAYLVVRTPGSPAGKYTGPANGSIDDQVGYFLDHMASEAPWLLDFSGAFWQVDTEKWPAIGGVRDDVDIHIGHQVCELLRSVTGLQVLHYAPQWSYGDTVPQCFPLWASRYVPGSGTANALYPGDTAPQWMAYSGRAPAILQFTSSGTVAGQTPADLNAFRGTESDFAHLITREGGGMTSPQHALWIRRGAQWQLALPLTALRDRMRRYGYTVYDIGDDSHLDRIPPEDHTPYSETGWPGTTPYGWVTAIDIMPPPAGSDLPSLQKVGAQLYADRLADLPEVAWLKYMNWGPASDRAAVHDEWEPNHVRRSSTDVGHIHLSCRSDVTRSAVGKTYDPIARLRGVNEEEEMSKQMLVDGFQPNPKQIWLCDGMTRRPVKPEWVGTGSGPITNNQVHQASLLGELSNNGVVFHSAGDADVWGVDVASLAVDPEAVAKTVTAAVKAVLDTSGVTATVDPTLLANAVRDAVAAAVTPAGIKAGTLLAFKEIGANIP